VKEMLSMAKKPGKPFSAVAVIVTVEVAPLSTVTLATGAVIATHVTVPPELSKSVPVWTVSGTGVFVPFDIVTQTPPVTLVPEQPV